MRDPSDRSSAERSSRWWWVPMLGAGTLLVFGGSGLWLISGIQDRALHEVLVLRMDTPLQLGLGSVIGFVMAIVAWLFLRTRTMDAVRRHYVDRIGPHVQRARDQWFLSLCAGVGEELFFRGALQAWLGIVLTAVLFVAIHGYLDPRRWRTMGYGVLLTGFMVGFGLMAAHWGLYAPILAHSVFDVILLRRMAKEWRERSVCPHER